MYIYRCPPAVHTNNSVCVFMAVFVYEWLWLCLQYPSHTAILFSRCIDDNLLQPDL